MTADEFRKRVATFRPQARRAIRWMSIAGGIAVGLPAVVLKFAGLISGFGAILLLMAGALLVACLMWWQVGRVGQRIGITCPDCRRRLVSTDERWDAIVLQTGGCPHCGAMVLSDAKPMAEPEIAPDRPGV